MHVTKETEKLNEDIKQLTELQVIDLEIGMFDSEISSEQEALAEMEKQLGFQVFERDIVVAALSKTSQEVANRFGSLASPARADESNEQSEKNWLSHRSIPSFRPRKTSVWAKP